MDAESTQTRLRVLVVDDRRDSGRVMKVLLERAGYDVVIVENLADALTSVREFRPDAIISDIALEEIRDGFELARSVRADASTPKPLLIALTGYDDDETRDAAVDAGFDHFLVKPPPLQDLMGLLGGIKR